MVFACIRACIDFHVHCVLCVRGRTFNVLLVARVWGYWSGSATGVIPEARQPI